MQKRTNWHLVSGQLAEAREELEHLEQLVADRTARSDGALEVGLEHAYHHLNFAWNARKMSDGRFRKLTTLRFRSNSRFPKLHPLGTK
jgi:hypothetical protein